MPDAYSDIARKIWLSDDGTDVMTAPIDEVFTNYVTGTLPPKNGEISIDILLDRSMIEVFFIKIFSERKSFVFFTI